MEVTQFTTTDAADLAHVAQAVLLAARSLPAAEAVVVTLSGDLGAGKTALTKALATALGVTEVVSSPTFVVMRRYDTTDDRFATLLHMDAYRIESLLELGPLGFDSCLALPNALFCIEWPERISAALPARYVAIAAQVLTPGTHQFTLTLHG